MINLGTTTDGTPTLELDTPRGQKRWLVGYSLSGPRFLEKADGKTPIWVREASHQWWRHLRHIFRSTAADQDAAQAFIKECEDYVRIATKTLPFANTETRRMVEQKAAAWHRKATATATPRDMAQTALVNAHKLSELLRRTDPKRATKEGTYETETKRDQPAVNLLISGGQLPKRAAEWAEQIRECYRWTVGSHNVESQVGRIMEMGGGGGSGLYKERIPLDGGAPLTVALSLASYERWKAKMMDRPWWFDPKRPDQAPPASERSQSPASYWSVAKLAVIEGKSLAETDAQLRLPKGRAGFVLPIALTNYGEPPRKEPKP